MKNANINVRIEESVYNELKEYGVDISDVVRSALVSEIEKKRIKKIMDGIGEASKAVKKIGILNIVNDIRIVRETR